MTDLGGSSLEGQVLFQYDLYPVRIEQVGKVKRVITSSGTFAVKETKLNEQQQEWFIHCMDRLKDLGYSQVVPITRTKYGDHTVTLGSKTYYMMPWIEEGQGSPLDKKDFLIEQIGKLHQMTAKQQSFSAKAVKDSYKALLKRFNKRQEQMELLVERVEKKTYPSPLDLSFLSYFHQLMRMAEDAQKRLTRWYELCLEEKRFRSVLCHGKATQNHVLCDKNGDGYLINFENASLDIPVRDLAIIFRSSLNGLDLDKLKAENPLQEYEKYFSLFYEERILLSSFLSYPETVFSCVEQLMVNKHEYTQGEIVKRFERRFKSMKQLKKFADQLIENSSSKTHI
jgi:spore coat protein YsxE